MGAPAVSATSDREPLIKAGDITHIDCMLLGVFGILRSSPEDKPVMPCRPQSVELAQSEA
jgi:hypothetical protein